MRLSSEEQSNNLYIYLYKSLYIVSFSILQVLTLDWISPNVLK